MPDLRVEQRDCRNRCRDVIELYGDETDVAGEEAGRAEPGNF